MAMGVLGLPTPAAAQSTLYWSGSGSWAESHWKIEKDASSSEAWNGAVGVFFGDGGEVKIEHSAGFERLEFEVNGYTIKGGELRVDTTSDSAELSVKEGLTTTIESVLVDGSANILRKTGQGTLLLKGSNSYSGEFQLTEGRIDLGNKKGLGEGVLTMGDYTTLGFAVNGLVIENALQLNSRQDPTIDTGTYDGTWAGVIRGDGSLTKMGTGSLTLSSIENNYNGTTEVREGTLRAGAANTFSPYSAHNVAAGARLDLAGHDQTLARLNNSGSVQLSGVSGTPGTVLKITGAYAGDGGKLGIATVLNGNGSASDRLLISGPDTVASGNTTVQVTNLGGLGAPTTGNGIEIISTEDGGRLQSGAFTLAGGHVDAGAYEYRLLQTSQGASLQSTFVQPPDVSMPVAPDTGTLAAPATRTPVPAYRVDAPLVSALPAQLRQADMAMLGDMRKRVGDEMGRTDGGRRAWGRILRTDPRIRQQGTVSPESSGHLNGFQAGLDVYADTSVTAGLYVGQLEGSLAVNGFASGVEGKAVGFNRLQSRYLGLYGSWQSDAGVYADSVVQWADYRSHLHTEDSTSTTKGSGWLASLEVGKPVALNSRWQIEPQAQLIYRQMRLDDTTLSAASVQHSTPSDWTLRLGMRIKGSLATRAGVFQPYGRVNIYKASRTTDVASFITPVARTDIQARGGNTSTELAAGATLQLNQRTSFYGELGRLWANRGDTRVKSGLQASVGVKVRW